MAQVIGGAAHGELTAFHQDEAGAVLLVLECGLFKATVLGIVVVPAGGSALLELAAAEAMRRRQTRKAIFLTRLMVLWFVAGTGSEGGAGYDPEPPLLGFAVELSCMLISCEPAVAVVSLRRGHIVAVSELELLGLEADQSDEGSRVCDTIHRR